MSKILREKFNQVEQQLFNKFKCFLVFLDFVETIFHWRIYVLFFRLTFGNDLKTISFIIQPQKQKHDHGQ